MKIILPFLLLLSLTSCMQNKYAEVIHTSLPPTINTNSHYLVFMHGKIIEKKGLPAKSKRHGPYEYEAMLDRFAASGFTVISQTRNYPVDIFDYAVGVSEQIEKLLAAGVPAHNISVAGFSKGGRMALVVSSFIQNRDINYIILAGCRTSDIDQLDLDLYGRVLSIYDISDDKFESCSEIFSASKGITQSREIALDTGLGHGLFYSPLDIWLSPMTQWPVIKEKPITKPFNQLQIHKKVGDEP